LLQKVNLRARRPFVVIHLTQRNSQTHVACETTDLRWTQLQSNTVLFYEFCFHGDFADVRARVWRGRIELFHHENVIQHDPCGGCSVMP
jgi:hypothetical protein